MSHRSRCDGFF